MIEIIRDPMWQFVGVVLVIIIPLILYLVQRRRKVLSWEIISNTPLLSIEEEIRGNLQVLFDGKPVQDVQLIIVEIINSGNVSIKSTDYERPISLDFGENAHILTAEVTETTPDNLDVSIDIEGTKVLLNPTLMNGKDSIAIKTIVSQFNDKITVEGRIVGVKEVQKSTKRNKIQAINSFIMGVGGGLASASIITYGTEILEFELIADLGIAAMMMMLLTIIIIIILIYYKSHRNHQ